MRRMSTRLRVRLTVLVVLAALALLLPTVAMAAPSASAGHHWQSGCSSHHTVRPGQTLSGIAAHYGVSMQALMQVNNIWNPNRIFVGQVLCIPGGSPPPNPGPGCSAIHTVRYGETLSSIARAYGVSAWAIMQANNIANPNQIFGGQRLCIPGGGWVPPQPPQPPPACTAWHIVRPGQTLSGIAAWYGTTVSVLMQINGISNPNHIWVGQSIMVPVSCQQPPPPPNPCAPHPQCPPPPPPPPPPCAPNPQCPPPPPPPCQQHPQPCPPPQPSGFWSVSFWSNPDLAGQPVFNTSLNAPIAYDWGMNAPVPGLPSQNWSGRWTRTEWVRAGTYRIFATTDDGVRVFVDNQLIIDGWRVQAAASYFGDVMLGEGNHEFRVEYFQASGVALLYVNYSRLQ